MIGGILARCADWPGSSGIVRKLIRGLLLLGFVAAATLAVLALTRDGAVVLTVQAGRDDSSATAGTADDPYGSIGAAVRRADALTADGTAVRIRVLAGTYREELTVDGGADHAPLTIEGQGADSVVVTGADVFTNWQPLGDGSVVEHPWDAAWGLAELPDDGWEQYFRDNNVGDVTRRREGVWIDGHIVRQLLDPGDVERFPGTFAVDEQRRRLVLHPPAGIDPDAATIEVAVRASALTVVGRQRVQISGITFQQAATPLQSSAVTISDSNGVVVRDAAMHLNSWGGLGIRDSRDVTVQRVSTSSNGVIGLSVYRSSDLDLLAMVNNDNNTWRGRWGGYAGWEVGAKIFRARDVRIVDWEAIGNYANGLWLDTDVAGVLIDNAVLAGNLRRGLFLEAVQGPITVRSSLICGNGDNGGIVDGKSDNVTIENTQVSGNADAQLLISGEAGGRSFTAYDTGTQMTITSEDWTLRNNVFVAADDDLLVESHLTPAEFATFIQTLRSSGNQWSAARGQPFHTAQGALDLAGWQDLTGQDADAQAIQPPALRACPRAGAGG